MTPLPKIPAEQATAAAAATAARLALALARAAAAGGLCLGLIPPAHAVLGQDVLVAREERPQAAGDALLLHWVRGPPAHAARRGAPPSPPSAPSPPHLGPALPALRWPASPARPPSSPWNRIHFRNLGSEKCCIHVRAHTHTLKSAAGDAVLDGASGAAPSSARFPLRWVGHGPREVASLGQAPIQVNSGRGPIQAISRRGGGPMEVNSRRRPIQVSLRLGGGPM